MRIRQTLYLWLQVINCIVLILIVEEQSNFINMKRIRQRKLHV